ncbi:Holliday junction branch migration helicase [Paramecium bursaria Chlorella virus NYs1]|uniref:Helicase n=1 Tax=Paramecium bursaria Chlorella virus NYs1 TaxID=83442 RepID=M1IJM3_9PHYC|nr:Holliday junction branch migration helicase [Paramecium bursaria Chlorella virus NYs1]AGE54835.1 helicase [Paramecium bursaria Chlorella virus MA1D]AGE58690.1 helicase [Paramecium bursaria Chlorella virus NYs1]
MSFESTLKHPLDQFQKDAIKAMDNDHSVFVAAHTSSGKTVIAEYAYHISGETNIVYTTPLKAISNQKYKDFSSKFGAENVGIITGDVVKNETAKLLIMTTEIFRIMVIKHDQRIQNVKWVIFDEVHYINDKSRGSVWEESIILMPDTMRAVFLSATVPNAVEFSKWFSKLKNHPVDVVSTKKRPIPLKYNVIHNNEIKDIESFDKILADSPEEITKDTIKMLYNSKLTPCIIFSCNKKKIDRLAQKLYKSVNIMTTYESKNIKRHFNDLLKKCQVPEDSVYHQKYLEYACEGIGVHHAGVVPYVKEIIEILYCKGIIPVLISTETVAVGVNGPAHSVLFESLFKFDGLNNRLLREHEFIQMAGRAGRRGFDEEGRVFVLHDPAVERGMISKLINGKPETLHSSLKMSANLVLNCIQRNMNIEDIINDSFDSFCPFVPTEEDRSQVYNYNKHLNKWMDILSRPDIWRHIKKGYTCTLNSGITGTFTEISHNGRYKISGEDGNEYSSGVVEILGPERKPLDFKKMKIKDFVSACAIAELKKIPYVDKHPNYDKVMEYEQLKETNEHLLHEYNEYTQWLTNENMMKDGLLTPIGEIGCSITSICPIIGTKLLDNTLKDTDIIMIVSTFFAELDNSSIGTEIDLSYRSYTPRFLNWDLVNATGIWYDGKDIPEICEELGIFEGNLISVLVQINNTLNELIAAKPDDTEKLENIQKQHFRGILKTASLYV